MENYSGVDTSVLNGVAFDPFAVVQDGLSASEVDVGGCEISQAFVVSPEVIVLDEATDMCFEIAGQVIVFEQDAVLERGLP